MIIQTGLEPNQTRTEPSHNNSECLNQTEFEPNLHPSNRTQTELVKLTISSFTPEFLIYDISLINIHR